MHHGVADCRVICTFSRYGPNRAYSRLGTHLGADERHPSGRVAPSPIRWIGYPSGRHSWDAVIHAHRQFLVSQDIDVEPGTPVLEDMPETFVLG